MIRFAICSPLGWCSTYCKNIWWVVFLYIFNLYKMMFRLIGKSPFDGKTYNDILSQNRACNIKLDGVEYLRLPLQSNTLKFSSFFLSILINNCIFYLAYDLLKRMLEKDPRQRITSAEALRHPYFDNGVVKNNQQNSNVSESTQDEIREESDSSTK